MSPCLGTPGLSQDNLSPMGSAGTQPVGQWERVTSQTERGHHRRGMGNIMGWRKREFWGFRKASYGMFRGESSDRERNRST